MPLFVMNRLVPARPLAFVGVFVAVGAAVILWSWREPPHGLPQSELLFGLTVFLLGPGGLTLAVSALAPGRPWWSVPTAVVTYAVGVWVLLEVKPDDAPPELVAAVKRLLEAKYTLFASHEELKPHQVDIQQSGDYEGRSYRGGFLFSFRVEVRSPTLVVVHFSDYEGPLAASSHSVSYRWVGDRWKKVAESALLVS